jgi:hypothetical protein
MVLRHGDVGVRWMSKVPARELRAQDRTSCGGGRASLRHFRGVPAAGRLDDLMRLIGSVAPAKLPIKFIGMSGTVPVDTAGRVCIAPSVSVITVGSGSAKKPAGQGARPNARADKSADAIAFPITTQPTSMVVDGLDRRRNGV